MLLLISIIRMHLLRSYELEKNLRQHVRMYHTPGQFKCEVEGCGSVFIWKV